MHKSLVGQACLWLLGVQLFFLSSFVALDLPTGTGGNLASFLHDKARTFVHKLPARWEAKVIDTVPAIETEPKPARSSLYVPQAPVAIFCGYVLGPTLAPIVAGSFLIFGLVGPIFHVHPFASGGGFDYYTQPGFGYLIGLVIAAYVVAKITDSKRTSLSQLLALVAGLAAVHVTGLIYMLGACLVFAFIEGHLSWQGWVFDQARNLSWYPLPYDFIFGLVAIGLGFPFRWLAHTLTAPDIGLRSERQYAQIRSQKMEELMH